MIDIVEKDFNTTSKLSETRLIPITLDIAIRKGKWNKLGKYYKS